MRSKPKFSPVILVVMATSVIYGCQPQTTDLKLELSTLTTGVRGKIDPLPPVQSYTPFPYTSSNLVDPFGLEKIQLATRNTTTNQKAPDMNRPKEPLESYSVDIMQFSGTIDEKGVVHALISVDGNLHAVKIGAHMGKNFGKVVKISENDLTLLETVQNPDGEWVERTTNLAVQAK